MSSSKGGSSPESGWLCMVEVLGLTVVFFQVLEVWPVDLHKKHVILSSVKNTLKSV